MNDCVLEFGYRYWLTKSAFEGEEAEGTPPPRKKVEEFFDEHRSPSDKQVHDWATSKGYDTEEVERDAYELAGKYMSFKNHGKMKEEGKDYSDFKPEQLREGAKVEMEHTDDPEVAKRIAGDHTAEIEDYYLPWLKNMEETAEEVQEKSAYYLGYCALIASHSKS